MTTYTMHVTTPLPYDEAVAQVREALTQQGFGILTEIDVRATMQEKLGIDVPAQMILGACRPELAHRAMAVAPSIATLLPCNVTVRACGDGAVVEAIDPGVMSALETQPAIAEVATETRARLRAALDRIVMQEA